MIPLRDEDRPPIVPWATLGLLAVCAAVFAYQLTLRGDAAQAFVDAWVLDPHRLGVTRLYTLLTSAFIHATWGHIVSNLLFLWVFGPGVEERSGGVRFLALYLACALAGALAYLWWPGGPDTPLVGASGAISGVLGAALVLRPRAHLRVAVLAVVVPVGVTRLQTWFLLALWLAAQVAAALAPVKPGALPIAWVAHLAGFALGALAGAWLRWREPA